MSDRDISQANANFYRQQAAAENMAPDPFSHYAYMGNQHQQQLAAILKQQLLGQGVPAVPALPTTAAGGAAQLAAGFGKALYDYQKQAPQFPDAPGGAAPSLGTSIANFFTGRNNGGLY